MTMIIALEFIIRSLRAPRHDYGPQALSSLADLSSNMKNDIRFSTNQSIQLALFLSVSVGVGFCIFYGRFWWGEENALFILGHHPNALL